VKALVPVSIALAPITAFCCAAFSRWMRRRGVGQQIRELGPQGHAEKAGTPTMGGLLVLSAWAIAVLSLWPIAEWARPIGFVLAAGALHGGIGLLDDVRSFQRRRSLGLTAPWKLVLGSLAAIALFFLYRDVLSVPQRIPFSAGTVTLPPIATFALLWVTLLATTNSMNLTDGLDGLAGGVAVLALIGLLVLTPSRSTFVLVLPLLGALIGFLWTNAHPARLILGDVGSFGLGGIVAAVSLVTGTAFFLPLVAGVLVLEAGSVIAQVASYRIAGVRLFKMAPLHHHFEDSTRARTPPLLRGLEWPEAKITVRFWLLQAVFVAVALWAGRGM
jgi:phospho-N-acetylmuramoyl-pentapeptide-transferase